MLNHEARRQEHRRHPRRTCGRSSRGRHRGASPADAGRYPPPMPNSSTFPPRLTCPQRARLRADAPRDLRAESAKNRFLVQNGFAGQECIATWPGDRKQRLQIVTLPSDLRIQIGRQSGYFPFRTFGSAISGPFWPAFGRAKCSVWHCLRKCVLAARPMFRENEKMMMASVSELDPALEHLDMIFALVDF